MSHGPGCQVDAGIITDQCKLTPKAKKKFIQDVKNELLYGSGVVPTLFPCGPKLQPNPFAGSLDLENEKKFPEFHKHVLGSYEKIACALNLKSDFKLLPICDPIALGFKFNVNINLEFPSGFVPFIIPNLPLLALKMKLKPPKLAAKFPGIPAVPPPLPTFQVPPNIKPPFVDLLKFSAAFALAIPEFLAQVVLQIPKLALSLPNLPDLFAQLCKLAFNSKLFGDIKPTSAVEIVAVKVLTTKVVEMVFIAAVGSTLGSAPAGITGGIGKTLGYDPPPPNPSDPPPTVRDQIVNFANGMNGLSYGAGGNKRDDYASDLLPVEYQTPGTGPSADPRALGKKRTLGILEVVSSCGLVARACLAAGGASYVGHHPVDTSKLNPQVKLYYDFFVDRYKDGTAISGIVSAAKFKDATIDYVTGDLPALKKGDCIIVRKGHNTETTHIMVLVKDYQPGSYELTTIEGGQLDTHNHNRSTAIKKVEYVKGKTVPKGSHKRSMYLDGYSHRIHIGGREVLYLIDGEKVCTSTKGSNMNVPNTIDDRLAKDGPGEGFQKESS